MCVTGDHSTPVEYGDHRLVTTSEFFIILHLPPTDCRWIAFHCPQAVHRFANQIGPSRIQFHAAILAKMKMPENRH